MSTMPIPEAAPRYSEEEWATRVEVGLEGTVFDGPGVWSGSGRECPDYRTR